MPNVQYPLVDPRKLIRVAFAVMVTGKDIEPSYRAVATNVYVAPEIDTPLEALIKTVPHSRFIGVLN